jgi:AmpD protein
MKALKIDDGWLKDTKYVHSPHYCERPDVEDISLLVIHYISLPPEEFGGDFIDRFFAGTLDPSLHPYFEEIKELRVSAHCLINRQGEITQYVNFNEMAWHAGVSCFEGREKCNEFSIGIELEGSNNQPFTEAQYQTLAKLSRTIMRQYPKITPERIAGHNQIAPERKIDPGQYFDWAHYHALLEKA